MAILRVEDPWRQKLRVEDPWRLILRVEDPWRQMLRVVTLGGKRSGWKSLGASIER